MPEKFTITRRYWLRGIDKTDLLPIAKRVIAYWQDQGHTVTSTGGFEQAEPSVGGMSKPDNYILALVWTPGNNLYLASTSTCVWPNGTPEPAKADVTP